jgi:opacity protein-like surface antigen
VKRTIVAAACAAVLSLGSIASAFADPPPPTNGGNGAGSSGQCTGNPDDRPASCHDQGGPGNQP